MGAFSGACLLAMAGAFAASQIYDNRDGAAAMSAGRAGAMAGALVGAGIGRSCAGAAITAAARWSP